MLRVTHLPDMCEVLEYWLARSCHRLRAIPLSSIHHALSLRTVRAMVQWQLQREVLLEYATRELVPRLRVILSQQCVIPYRLPYESVRGCVLDQVPVPGIEINRLFRSGVDHLGW